MKLPYLDYCEDEGGVTIYANELWDYDNDGCYFAVEEIPTLIKSLTQAYEMGAVIHQRLKEAKRKKLFQAVLDAQSALEAFDNGLRT